MLLTPASNSAGEMAPSLFVSTDAAVGEFTPFAALNASSSAGETLPLPSVSAAVKLGLVLTAAANSAGEIVPSLFVSTAVDAAGGFTPFAVLKASSSAVETLPSPSASAAVKLEVGTKPWFDTQSLAPVLASDAVFELVGQVVHAFDPAEVLYVPLAHAVHDGRFPCGFLVSSESHVCLGAIMTAQNTLPTCLRVMRAPSLERPQADSHASSKQH